MPWRCVYRLSDGAAVSFGTDVDAPVPEGHGAALVEGPPNKDRMWDAATKGFKPRPVNAKPDRLKALNADLNQDPLLKDLTAQQRNRLDALVMRHLGLWRHKNG